MLSQERMVPRERAEVAGWEVETGWREAAAVCWAAMARSSEMYSSVLGDGMGEPPRATRWIVLCGAAPGGGVEGAEEDDAMLRAISSLGEAGERAKFGMRNTSIGLERCGSGTSSGFLAATAAPWPSFLSLLLRGRSLPGVLLPTLIPSSTSVIPSGPEKE